MIEIFATERLKKIYPEVQSFLRDCVFPIEQELISRPFFEVEGQLNNLRAEVKKRGLFAPHMHENWGSMHLSLVEFAQISELLGTTPLGHYVFNAQAPDVGNMELLAEMGSNELKEKYLRPLVAGDIRSCFSMTEPEFAGSNPVQMATTAVRDGNEYVVNGHKWFTTAADGATFTIVMAVTKPEEENPYARASMILVPLDTPGFERVRNIPIMGEAGEGYLSHAEVKFTNCRVPASNLIGADGAGFVLAQMRLGPGRIHHCMRWIGICERAFDMMCERAATREIAPGVKLGEKQMVQQMIAESRAEIDAARLMVLHTALKMDQEGQKAASQQISTIKFYVANVLQQVLDRAIQIYGAMGITDDTVLSFWYRHERGARIYDGPDETHKASLARKILKTYGLKIKNR